MELPVLVTLPSGALVQRLGPEGFVGRGVKGPIPLESVETERGARRILFVVENAKRVPEAARKIEAAVIREIVSKADAEDVFGLLTARGPRKEIRFGESRESLQAAANEIEAGMKGKNQEDAVLDSVYEGAGWFQPGRAGDAIFVLTMGIEKNNQVSFDKVRDRLTGAGIRVFGFQLGMLISGYIYGGVGMGPGGQLIPTANISANRENFFALSMDTGGFASLENAEGDPQKRYRLTDERLRVVQYMAAQEYKAAVEYYRVRVQNPPKEMVLDLAEAIRKQIPQAMVIYPKTALACSPYSNSPKH
ncbi:MAG: hypothetical protein LAN71_12865 [Acidobacteriia bacterium]|nr:hypothetical protein [Terriglobia bacterium]